MHEAGAAALKQVLTFAELLDEQRRIACACGHQALVDRTPRSITAARRRNSSGRPGSHGQSRPTHHRDDREGIVRREQSEIQRAVQLDLPIDGSQMAFWTCYENPVSAAHVLDCDEYMLVVQGCYMLIINENRIPLHAGQEYLIPRGTLHSGEVVAGTRTIHAFGERRAARAAQR